LTNNPTSVAWSSGNYAYDGAGNSKAIGTATFAYDASQLEHLTYREIIELSKQKGAIGKIAKQMKKLIEQAPRLLEKRGK
jgi:hypothetical protein